MLMMIVFSRFCALFGPFWTTLTTTPNYKALLLNKIDASKYLFSCRIEDTPEIRITDIMFKSELMTKCRFFIPPEAAYSCISELGELGGL